MSGGWTQPCCDRCWTPFVVGTRGELVSPMRLRDEVRSDEVCVFCGNGTMSGIYIRVDPRLPLHQTEEEDE